MSQSVIARPQTLTNADDRRHLLAPSPLARESLIFLLFLPEENLGCIAYTWVNGEGNAGSMALVFGAENDQLFKTYVEGVAMPDRADFDDWQVGALHVAHGKPHEHARVRFDEVDGEGRRFALDYVFEAMTPAFTYHDNADGCPAVLADNRLEQSGRVSGTITIAGREIAFETTGHRDHSWGSRDWTAFHHYKWVNVQTPEGAAINFMHGFIVDSLYQLGYVDKDGLQSPIRSIETDIARDAEHYSYTSARFTLVDEEGRVTVIEGGPRTSLAVWPAGGLESHDAAGPCTADGVPGLMHIEEGWDPQFVARRKGIMALQAGSDADAAREVLAVNRGVGQAH
ncbi:MAG: hypothetical protein ABWX92_13115 [Mycetocola sp.]